MRSKTGRVRGADGLRAAIQHTGYYPEVVCDAVFAALAGEDAVDFHVHHEPTFEHDEVRRHLTVVVISPTRLLLTHTDEHPAGDELLPEPYTSTSTEAIALSSIKTVAVTRMVTSPAEGPSRAAEAVLTQLEISLDLIAELAARVPGFLAVNAAPALPLPAEVVDRADLIIVNEYEYSQLPQLKTAKLVAVTYGAEGSALLKNGEQIAFA